MQRGGFAVGLESQRNKRNHSDSVVSQIEQKLVFQILKKHSASNIPCFCKRLCFIPLAGFFGFRFAVAFNIYIFILTNTYIYTHTHSNMHVTVNVF